MTQQEFNAVYSLMKDIETPVILELGAYCGEDSYNFERIVNCNPSLLHVMVEPDPHNYRLIEANEHRPLTSKRRLIRGAIGAESGARLFHFSYDSRDGSRGSGSIVEPTGHKDHFPTISFEASAPAMVECFALDEIFELEHLGKIDLLWVDIQGAEREMIQGGRTALLHTRYCFMEAEEIELYAGQALKPELIAMLDGWKLIEDFGFNILLENEKFSRG